MEKHINIDDTYMNVISFGKGKKVFTVIAGVSLTGLEGMGEALENLFSIFTDEYTVYVFDRKKVLKAGCSTEDMADDIYMCLKSLGVEHSVIYGASQGGMIGQVLAIKYPELVEKLVVCSSVSRVEEDNQAINLWLSAAREYDVEKVNSLFLEYVYSDEFVDSIRDSIPDLVKNGTKEDCERFTVMVEAVKSFNVYDKLDRIQCPVFVICDKKDKVFNYESSLDIVAKLNCESYVYDKYSHAVYDEAKDFIERIYNFVKR